MKQFSERIGVRRPAEIQIDKMSDDLRNTLWNLFRSLYQGEPDDIYWQKTVRYVARHFAKIATDELPAFSHEYRGWLKNYFFKLEWDRAYDLVEFIASNHTYMTAIESPYTSFPDYHEVSEQELIVMLNSIWSANYLPIVSSMGS